MGMAIIITSKNPNPSLYDMPHASFDFSGEMEYCDLPLQYWSLGDYYTQWIQALTRVRDQLLPAALITSIFDSDVAANVVAWVMFPLADGVVAIQQRIVLRNKLFGQGNAIDYDMLRTRETADEDGNTVSEWIVNMDDVSDVIDNLQYMA